MLVDLPLIILCWLLLLLWQLLGFPLLYKIYAGKSIDALWGFGRLTVWLVIGLIVWILAHLGLPANQPFFIYFLLLILSVYSLRFYWTKQTEVKAFLKSNWSLILGQELVFLFFFFFLSIVRGYSPRIEGLEKFMDVGFMAAYLRSPTLPAEDMWLARAAINYYTFGHFLGAIVLQYWSIGVDYGYNLLLGMIMALVSTQAAGLIINFVGAVFQTAKTKNKKVKKYTKFILQAGLIGSVLLVLGGNGHAAWYWLSNKTFADYWYPSATRFIENTIHEFPAYSFIVSDLHAHVWALPIVLFIIINIFLWIKALFKADTAKLTLSKLIKQSYFPEAVILGLLLGIAISTSTWDFLIYGLLLLVSGLLILAINKSQFYNLFFSALIIGLLALLTAGPWLLNFDSISQGVRMVEQRSPLWQLLVLWGPHVLITVLSSILAVKYLRAQKKLSAEAVMFLAMAVTSVVLLILPEIVYMKDIYLSHPRANTMFKLTFQAFVMMTLSAGSLIGVISWLHIKQKLSSFKIGLLMTILLVFLLAVGSYPYFGYRDYYASLKNYQTLDGLQWLQRQAPNDYLAINWLRTHVSGRPVVLEAVGESYTTYARVSSFTGLPTVLGWRKHQWLWRGSFDIPGQRTQEVKTMYEQPQSNEAQNLFKKYQVKYIFIGSKEREAYSDLAVNQLLELGEVVFDKGSVYVVSL